jgi:hypothetical protein
MTPGKERRPAVAPSQTPIIADVAPVSPHAPSRGTACGTRRWKKRIAALLLLGLCLFYALGCGISGGSIPPGGSRLAGRVFMAEDPTQSIANATVSIQVTPPGLPVQTLQVTTDAQGAFAFNNVTTGPSSSRIAVSVQPGTANIQPLQWTFLLTANRPVTLLASLPPASFDVNRVTSVSLSPSIADVQVGDSLRFVAQARDKSGNILPVTPSLLIDGDLGTIHPDGTFTGTHSGEGSIVAFWYGGVTFSGQIITEEKIFRPAANAAR